MGNKRYSQPVLRLFMQNDKDVIMVSEQKVEDLWTHDVTEGGAF